MFAAGAPCFAIDVEIAETEGNVEVTYLGGSLSLEGLTLTSATPSFAPGIDPAAGTFAYSTFATPFTGDVYTGLTEAPKGFGPGSFFALPSGSDLDTPLYLSPTEIGFAKGFDPTTAQFFTAFGSMMVLNTTIGDLGLSPNHEYFWKWGNGDSEHQVRLNVGDSSSPVLLPLPGDANGDRVVDLTDFGILKDNFGAGTTRAEGDFNGDGHVDLTDFGLLKLKFGSGAAAVPEPNAFVLVGLAAAGLSAWRLFRQGRLTARAAE